MGTSIAFPYNQTVQAFTPTSGTYANNTFVVCATSNGIGAGQIQRSLSNQGSIQYKTSFPYNINAGGSSTSTLAFILNEKNGGINQSPPYYFVMGSKGENLWLYSFTPASDANSFGSSNIKQVGNAIDSFDTPVASVLYYPPLNLLFVGGNNGNLYTYVVSWNAQGVPSFSYKGANKNYTSPTGCAVSLTLAYLTPKNPSLIVTGLNQGNQNGSFYFPISSSNNGVLPNADGVIWYTNDSVATVVDQTNKIVYTATQTSLISHSFNNLQSQGTVIKDFSSGNNPQQILSLAGAGSLNPAKDDPYGQFSKGALFIGTVPASSGATNTTNGSIYTYDPVSNKVSVFQSKIVSGSPYSLYADNNLHLLVNAGSTGLYYYSVAYNEDAPETAALIPNIASTSSSHNIFALLVSLSEIAFGIVTEDPAAIAFGVAGVTADLAG
jgi:hypothetical protein